MISATCTCGRCLKCRNRESARRYRAQHAERHRAAVRRHRREHGAREVRRQRAYRAANPEKARARNAVNNALKAGQLVKGPCELAGPTCCGRIEAHHDDYSRPLDVRWLCAGHHREVEAS